MKKNLFKRFKKSSENDKLSARITNDTLAEHREKVLAGGRRFKYPVQYQKHKLVINSIIIGVVAIAIAATIGWYQLYVAQSTSEFMYRVTQAIPVQVASVDGEPVRYSDYLRNLRSDIKALLQQKQIVPNSQDGRRQIEYRKADEITSAERDAYARKLAQPFKISVSDKEIDDFIKKTIDSKSISLQAYEKTVLNNYYDWSLDDYRHILRDKMLLQKVSFSVDKDAEKKINDISAKLDGGADFSQITKDLSEDETTRASGGDVGNVEVSTPDVNNVIATARTMQPGQVSKPIEGINGYYIIKLISKDDKTVHYQRIVVKLTTFEKMFKQLQEQNKIHEYIKIDRSNTAPKNQN